MSFLREAVAAGALVFTGENEKRKGWRRDERRRRIRLLKRMEDDGVTEACIHEKKANEESEFECI